MAANPRTGSLATKPASYCGSAVCGCECQGELDPKKAVAGVRCAGAAVLEGRQADLVDVLWLQWLAAEGGPSAEERRGRLVELTKALVQEHLVRTIHLQSRISPGSRDGSGYGPG